jgi:hypothetical protein
MLSLVFSQKIYLYCRGSSFPLCFDSRFQSLSFRLPIPAVYFFSNDLVSSNLLRFEVLTVVLLKFEVLWRVRQNGLFVGCVAFTIKALRFFETSVNIYESSWRSIPMKSSDNLHTSYHPTINQCIY